MENMKSMKIITAIIAVALTALISPPPAKAQQPAAEDTLLFTITLVEDSTSLFYCNWSDNIRKSLAGPIMMSGNTFLFHSENGYALYNMQGKLLEE
ncbi:MAG: hypothetical protein LBH93_08420, partial [Chitinispirillales bacterium]|nr:hypothetical protein [Chitinispirillales bacterium]